MWLGYGDFNLCMEGYGVNRFSKKSSDRMKGVHPQLVKLANAVILQSPHDFGISQGVRTMEEQRKLYAQGRNGNPGPIVTWTMNSKHLIQKDGYGHAIDIVVYKDGKPDWSEKYYNEIADVFERVGNELGIKYVWGGNWKTSKDRPHYEIVA